MLMEEYLPLVSTCCASPSCRCSTSRCCGCSGASETGDAVSATKDVLTISFFVDDMTCQSCADKVALQVSAVDGVVAAYVDFGTKRADVSLAKKRAGSLVDVLALVTSLGYRVRSDAASSSTLPSSTNCASDVKEPRSTVRSHGNAKKLTVHEKTASVREDVEMCEMQPTFSVTHILIEGMSCGSCASRIEANLRQMGGVQRADVNFATMSGVITHNTHAASVPELLHRIRDMGYTVTLQRTTSRDNIDEAVQIPVSDKRPGVASEVLEYTLLIEGMRSASCATRIARETRHLEGVVECSVSFQNRNAVLRTLREEDCAGVVDAIEAMGFRANPVPGQMVNASMSKAREVMMRTEEIARQRRLFIGSALLSLPFVFLMILMPVTDIMHTSPRVTFLIDTFQLIIATPVLFHFGSQFFVGAWRGLQHGVFTMDTLVAIGTGCSYIYSVAAYAFTLVSGVHMVTYFDTTGMLISFMLLGRYLEANARRSTSGALIDLMSLVPAVATVVTPNGDLRLPSAAIKPGMLVRVLAGDRVPVDGVVHEGFSEIDEQMITGESIPKSVKPGLKVVGGTSNITAVIVVRTSVVGDDTVLAQILRTVQEAQTSKPAIQRIADRTAMYFVPFIMGLSLLVLCIWLLLGATDGYPAEWRHGTPWAAFAFNFFISTVVAACPCALGLATPTAIMVGTGVGAKNGVLVKSGVTLETVRNATCVVFDKTGTITNGHLQVVWQHTQGLSSEREIQQAQYLVGLTEAQSNHPIAKAVSAALLDPSHPSSVAKGGPLLKDRFTCVVCSVETHNGLGVEARVSVTEHFPDQHRHESTQRAVLVGNLSLMRQHGAHVDQSLEYIVGTQTALGRSTILGAIDGVACIAVALCDEPKKECAGVIRKLNDMGILTYMVTGDNRGVAMHIAQLVGMDPSAVYAEVMPVTKANFVRQLQSEGHRVIFVGDGINDGPALTQADVGVALGAGTEVAIEAADAVLVRNSLVDLFNLYALSSATVRRIYGNFLWAFGYNLVMLPFASGALFPIVHFQLPPVLAGAAMVFSSLSVLTSSLSLRCFKPYSEFDFST